MSRFSLAALGFAIAGLAWAGAAKAQATADPLKDPAIARVREAFKVDGIALFDPHSQHAARMGVCAASIFPALKWCVSGTAEEKKGAAAYIKTTGYNIDAESRIVYAISSRRSYPLRREEFDGIIQAIGERYGAGPALYAFKKKSEEGAAEGTGVDSLIAVWGGIRLVHLSEAEYAVVESGGSLKRGHLVDHRFNLVVSAKQREPVYKIEGDAGFILHIMATSPDRADVIARAVYQPVFLPPPGKPSADANNPLVTETVRRPTVNGTGERENGRAVAEERAKRVEAERGVAAERLLREEAERRVAEEKAARAEAERKLRAAEERAKKAEDDLKAKEEGRRKEEGERKAAEERAKRAERERMSSEERRRAEEAERKAAEIERRAAEERAKRAELERKAVEERRLKEEAERKAAEERAKRAEAERKILEERRRKEEVDRKSAEERAKRAEDGRKALEERQRKETAERKAADERRAAEQKGAKEESERKAAEERRIAEERRSAEEKLRRADAERAAEEGRKGADDPAAAERRAEAERLARERAARPESWKQLAADAAKASGAIWSFSETQDKVADERTLRSQTIFGGPDQPGNGQPGNGQPGNGRLAVEVSFECTIVAGERRLRALARGFDRKSGAGVAFRTEAEGTFGVRTRFRLDDQPQQDGLLFRERQDDMASLLEIPMTSADLGKKAPRAGIWLRHYAAAVEFNLLSGTVPATITPYADNLRRVLEACAQ